MLRMLAFLDVIKGGHLLENAIKQGNYMVKVRFILVELKLLLLAHKNKKGGMEGFSRFLLIHLRFQVI